MKDTPRRCGKTIHSDYVTDHRCLREHDHEGSCWFGASEVLAELDRVRALGDTLADEIDSYWPWVEPHTAVAAWRESR